MCMYLYVDTYVKYCIAITDAAEAQATSPTGNRAKSNHSYRQPVCIQRFWNEDPCRAPGSPSALFSKESGASHLQLQTLFSCSFIHTFSQLRSINVP